jgi:hypothetical protein
MRWLVSGILLLLPAALWSQPAPAAAAPTDSVIVATPGAAGPSSAGPITPEPSSPPPTPPTSPTSPTSPAPAPDLVQELLPDGAPIAAPQLTPIEQARIIPRLAAAQPQAAGKRARRIAFLLAALDSDYEKNRNLLVQALRGCNERPAGKSCDEDTARFVIILHDQGHPELLGPLLAAGRTGDGPVAEALGVLYHQVLTERPEEFVAAIRTLEPGLQDRLCKLAGRGAGGSTPGETDELNRRLKGIGGTLANRCLAAFSSAL